MFDQETAHTRVGAVIAEKYRLLRLISLGAMGAVYESVHEWTQRHVAVKLLFDDVANNRESVERFVREARSSSKVGHANIVEVLDLGRDVDDTLYLVQELLSGDTLRAELDRCRRLSLREIARSMLPILNAVDAAHAEGIVHRDIKPENIVLHHNGKGTLEPKLIDFGIARLDINGARLTQAGAILGTPNYMAPEQVRGELAISPRADLWAIGVVLYECATGKRPFSADNIRELFARILLEDPAPIDAIAPDLPPAFVALVRRALDRDPARRWPSARAMLIEFAAIHEVRNDPTLAATLADVGFTTDPTRTLVSGSAIAQRRDAPAPAPVSSDLPVNQTLVLNPPPPANATAHPSANLPANPQVAPSVSTEHSAPPAGANADRPTVEVRARPRTERYEAPEAHGDRERSRYAFAAALIVVSVIVGAFTLRRAPAPTHGEARTITHRNAPDRDAQQNAPRIESPSRDAEAQQSAIAQPDATARLDARATTGNSQRNRPPGRPHTGFIY